MASRIFEEISTGISTCKTVSEIITEIEKYGGSIPGGWKVEVPGPNIHINTPVGFGRCIMYTKMFTYGVRLPFDNFVQELLVECRLAPSQINPNGWAYIYAFLHLCHFLHYPTPSVALFSHLFYLRQMKVFYGFVPRKTVANIFTGADSSVKHWKNRFFVLTFGDMPIPIAWNLLVKASDFQMKPLTQEEVSFMSSLGQVEPFQIKLMARGIPPKSSSGTSKKAFVSISSSTGSPFTVQGESSSEAASNALPSISPFEQESPIPMASPQQSDFERFMARKKREEELKKRHAELSASAVGESSKRHDTAEPRALIAAEPIDEEDVPDVDALVRRPKRHRTEEVHASISFAPPVIASEPGQPSTASSSKSKLPLCGVFRQFEVPPPDPNHPQRQHEEIRRRIANHKWIPVAATPSPTPTGALVFSNMAEVCCRSLGFPPEFLTSQNALSADLALDLVSFPQDNAYWGKLAPHMFISRMESMGLALASMCHFLKQGHLLDVNDKVKNLQVQLDEAIKRGNAASEKALDAQHSFAKEHQDTWDLKGRIEVLEKEVSSYREMLSISRQEGEEVRAELQKTVEKAKVDVESAVNQARIDMIEFLPQALQRETPIDFDKLLGLVLEKEKADEARKAAEARAEEARKAAAARAEEARKTAAARAAEKAKKTV